MYHRSETEEKRGKEKPLEHIESGRSYMKYAIIGAGGCGGSIGAFLAEAGQDVTLIARGRASCSNQRTWYMCGVTKPDIYRDRHKGS